MNRVDPSTLAMPISGHGLRGATLGDQLAGAGALSMLVFLRHFGCPFCREMVRDLQHVTASEPAYPTVLLFGQGDHDETRDFMKDMWPAAPIVCDPERVIYNAMGLGRGSVFQMFGPSVWACGVRATLKGNFIGKPIGDPWTMPGVFVSDRTGAIQWTHEFRHQGDHPEWKKIPELLSALPASATLAL